MSSNSSGAVHLARGALEGVREASNGCKLQALREEGHGFAQKAQEILARIEDKVTWEGFLPPTLFVRVQLAQAAAQLRYS